MNQKQRSGDRPRAKHRRLRITGFIFLGLIVILGIARLILPWVLRDYVNRTLDRNPLYSGTIGRVQVHVVRGAYSIHDVRISKTTGDVPVPFFSAKEVDFAI